MKIAIATTTKDFSGEISEQGGRAPYYLILDEQKNILEAIKNTFAKGGGGAGPSVAKMLADKGVTKVTIGNIGEKMQQVLEERGLEYEVANGLIKDYLN